MTISDLGVIEIHKTQNPRLGDGKMNETDSTYNRIDKQSEPNKITFTAEIK